ncbi:unknown similar to AMEV022 [Adoxophyes honmai entomopoxvirus 'L']|uniref:Uncharacterized protein n=1 Tax=Adoxophyes honmai entomopoxvirus 'L' TaxID=1293540 RepID=A0A916NWM9_9POXV|nr:unknown similar to AMEV022 [Adoxophyes honmai entomopoxvirus 'L']CCU55348.1 unknown similar to AMEV022 [Adoxophyes honmai entomopoxvirus 'L']
MNFNLYLKWKINIFIDIIRPKNVNKCSAIVYNKPCNKLSKYKYCKSHYKIMKEYCALYHYWDKKYEYPDMNISDLIDVEIEMRYNYTRIFNIKNDFNHSKWILFLNSEKEKNYYNNIDIEYTDIIINSYYLKFVEYLNLETNVRDICNFTHDYSLKLPKKQEIFHDYFYNNIYNYNIFTNKRNSI